MSALHRLALYLTLGLLLTLHFASATPIVQSSSCGPRGDSPLIRSRRRDSDDDDHVFQTSELSLILRELNDIRSKYRDASSFLGELNLAEPDRYAGDAQGPTSPPPSTNATEAAPVVPQGDTSVILDNDPASASDAPLSSDHQPNLRTTARSTAVPLEDDIDANLDKMWSAAIQIGTPPQSLPVDLDTGSSDLWLPVNCTTNCNGKLQMQTQNSATFKTDGSKFAIQYGSGAASGVLASDSVSIGGLSVAGQFWGAVQQESQDFADDPISGLLGLAFGSIAASGKTPYFENLVNARSVASPLFGFDLRRRQATGSQLCLGCFDSTRFSGSPSWLPVVSQTYWSLAMTGITANGQHNVLSKSIVAAIDTGTTLIYIPSNVANAFYGQIPQSATANQYGKGFYTYPCAANLSISVSFANKQFSVSMLDFNLGRTSSGSSTCVGGILAVGDGFPSNLAIFGGAFLKSYYSIYDYGNGVRVGLAPSKEN